ncbi:MAG: hypothetical protein MJK15_11785 [Colwellia sp.]|nr:hypothetical protein [Colwellia sp.]
MKKLLTTLLLTLTLTACGSDSSSDSNEGVIIDPEQPIIPPDLVHPIDPVPEQPTLPGIVHPIEELTSVNVHIRPFSSARPSSLGYYESTKMSLPAHEVKRGANLQKELNPTGSPYCTSESCKTELADENLDVSHPVTMLVLPHNLQIDMKFSTKRCSAPDVSCDNLPHMAYMYEPSLAPNRETDVYFCFDVHEPDKGLQKPLSYKTISGDPTHNEGNYTEITCNISIYTSDSDTSK